MPGMNMPWNQVCYYFITLITAGAFHEVGHAVSAARYEVDTIWFFVVNHHYLHEK